MSDQPTLLSRIGSIFKRSSRDGELPLDGDHPQNQIATRSTFMRPWAANRMAIERLQDGFENLVDLMSTVKDTLEKSSKRQDELLQYLSHLPEALQAIPESSRIHGETLRAIHTQLEQQHGQQEKLAAILGKMNESGDVQREALGEIRERMTTINETDQAISSHLNSLGSALASVSQNSTTGAQVLEQMRDRIDTRDGQLEKILQRQSTRFTTMLSIAIFLSIAALAAVCVMGYLILMKK